MSCPSNKPKEIRICSQNKVVEDELRKILKKYKLQYPQTDFNILPSSGIKKSPKIKKLTKKTKNCKKRCVRGSHCNSKTGRCNKTKKKTKTHTKLHIIKNTTPSLNKELKFMITPSIKKEFEKLEPYSPSINRAMAQLRTISPNPDIFDCIKNREIKVQTKKGSKCFSWTSKKAQETMLNNLLSKKPLVCTQITAPKQILSNCWFNAYFMIFFVSDKGRSFFRYLRESMITGYMPKYSQGKYIRGETIAIELKWPLFLLNKYIDASLRGIQDPSRFAKLMDTNVLIRKIHNALDKIKRESYQQSSHGKKTLHSVAPTGKASNPLSFYTALMDYLYPNISAQDPINILKSTQRVSSQPKMYPAVNINIETFPLKLLLSKHTLDAVITGKLPKILILEINDEDAQKMYNSSIYAKKKHLKVKIKNKTYKYVLDSVVLRDIKKGHFSAYITCNKKDYAFDGESFSRIEQFNWKNNLNKDVVWSFDVRKYVGGYFNFTKGYQLLFYYLESIIK